MSNRPNAEMRRRVGQRARDLCEYCRSPAAYSISSFCVEHVRPTSKGGTNIFSNLALSCADCNNSKYAKQDAYDPITGKLVPLYNPRRHRWTEHFTWSEDYLMIIGLTPIGRATVESLRVNRIGLINVRRLLVEVQKHPPKNDLAIVQKVLGHKRSRKKS